MNGIMEYGDLSTRKVIDLLRHGLERCIVCLVKQEKSNLPIDEVSLTKRQDKRSYSALASQTPKPNSNSLTPRSATLCPGPSVISSREAGVVAEVQA